MTPLERVKADLAAGALDDSFDELVAAIDARFSSGAVIWVWRVQVSSGAWVDREELTLDEALAIEKLADVSVLRLGAKNLENLRAVLTVLEETRCGRSPEEAAATAGAVPVSARDTRVQMYTLALPEGDGSVPFEPAAPSVA
jgi:hypothetical protein